MVALYSAEFVLLVEKDELLSSLRSSVIIGVDFIFVIIERLVGVNQEHVVR
jgi:hypothetical protein